MMEGKLRLRYLDDTRTIAQVWDIFPYFIAVIYNIHGDLIELIIDEHENI